MDKNIFENEVKKLSDLRVNWSEIEELISLEI
jgi:hypothetical protein